MEYVLNDNLSKEELMNLGFTNRNKPFLYYHKALYTKSYFDTVTLNITINLDTNEFNIIVLDEAYFQPYLPFYNERSLYFYDEKNIYNQEVLNIVKENFNKEMNILVENGVFRKKDKVKTL